MLRLEQEQAKALTRRARRKAQRSQRPQRETGLLEQFGAVGAALGVVADLGVLVGAEAAVSGVADGVGHGGDLVAVVLVDVVDGLLAAVGDGEGVAGLVAGGEVIGDELRGLRGGVAGAGLAARAVSEQEKPCWG
jgi:hypothetical protein